MSAVIQNPITLQLGVSATKAARLSSEPMWEFFTLGTEHNIQHTFMSVRNPLGKNFTKEFNHSEQSIILTSDLRMLMIGQDVLEAIIINHMV